MFKVYMIREFEKWSKKEMLRDIILYDTALEVSKGLHDGDLGSGCFKKRIAIKGKGKRSGARTILTFKINHFVIYIYAYSKNEKNNLSPKEQRAIKLFSKDVLMNLTGSDIDKMINNGELKEIENEQ